MPIIINNTPSEFIVGKKYKFVTNVFKDSRLMGIFEFIRIGPPAPNIGVPGNRYVFFNHTKQKEEVIPEVTLEDMTKRYHHSPSMWTISTDISLTNNNTKVAARLAPGDKKGGKRKSRKIRTKSRKYSN